LAEVARAADRLGFEGVLTPTGTWCEDAWLTSAALLAETEKLKFLVAFRPGLVPPTLAAQQTATLQRFSGGRVLLNVVSGSDDAEQRRFGDFLSHDERYARTAEFLEIVTSVWAQDSVDFAGKYYTVNDARVSAPPDPLPGIYFGGSSAAALPIAAEFADVYLTWGEPPQAAAGKIDKVRAEAVARGRTVRFGIRLHTISRDTSDAAWAVANELLAELTEEQIAKATAQLASSESEGQRRTSRPTRDLPQPVGGSGPGSRRCRYRAGRQPPGSRRPDSRVPLAGLRRVHPVRLPAPGRGVLVRRGCAAVAGLGVAIPMISAAPPRFGW
jgi:alkanesulfonate monooxygenase